MDFEVLMAMKRFLKPVSSNQESNEQNKSLAVGRTVALMTLLTLMGQFLALARESTIAAQFGASNLTDAFLLAVMIPNAVLLLIQNGLLMAFIPILAETLTVDGEEQAWKVGSNLINWTLLTISLLGVIVVVSADIIVSALAPMMSADTHLLTVRMLRMLVLIDVFGVGAALLAGILNVYRVYTITTLFRLVLNVTTILGVILLADHLSIYALVLATISAYAFQVLLLLLPLRRIQRYRFILDAKDQAIFKILRLAWPAALTLLLQQVIVFFDRGIAVRLGVGNVAALSFATKLVFVIPPLLVGAVSTIVLPELSRLIARGDWSHAKDLASSILRYTVVGTLPVATVLFVVRQPITILVFERGAFTRAATDLTANTMGFYVLGLVAMSMHQVIVRLFYASHDTLTPLLSGGLRLGVNLGLDIILARVLGIGGIALAYAIAISLDVVVMLVVLARRWRMSLDVIFLIKASLATGALFAASQLALRLSGNANLTPQWFNYACLAIVSAISGGVVYLGACFLLDISEAKTIFAAVAQRVRLARLRMFGRV